MQISLSKNDLANYVNLLVTNHLPDGHKPKYEMYILVDKALERLKYCFEHINRKYFREENTVFFNHLNGDHFCMYLYFLANSIWNETGDTEWPTRLFYLNKIMHGIDLYFSVQLPSIFRLVHPVGTVLGRADYDNYLVAYQNVSVGADEAGIYPKFGEGTVLYSRVSVIGDCKVGNDVCFAANTFVLNTDVPDNCVVVGQYPQNRFLPNLRSVKSRHFERNHDK